MRGKPKGRAEGGPFLREGKAVGGDADDLGVGMRPSGSSRRRTEKTPKGAVTKEVTRISENEGAGFIPQGTVCL
jgi:hypothetical protein